MARFCEQRCLSRYLEDLAEQEEVRLTNTWMCPCCRGIEPVGKYKNSDMARVEDKDEEDSEPETPSTPASSETTTTASTTTPGTITTSFRSRIPPAQKRSFEDSQSPLSDAPVPKRKESSYKTHVETEDDFCAVCGDIYPYNNNEIIFCEGCNVAAHQACYGVSKVPEGDWHCDRCIAKTTPQCCMCGLKGGAMKQLLDKPHDWIHVTCIATLYECSPIELDSKIGPLGVLDKIDKRRFKLKCEICREKNRKEIAGPLIQCAAKKCTKAFHPICAQRKLVYSKEISIFVTYCVQHAPVSQTKK